MSDCSGDAESSYGGPASPTLINTPLEEFPPAQPAMFAPTPGIPRRLTPTPNAPVPTGENPAIINRLVNTSEAHTHNFEQQHMGERKRSTRRRWMTLKKPLSS